MEKKKLIYLIDYFYDVLIKKYFEIQSQSQPKGLINILFKKIDYNQIAIYYEELLKIDDEYAEELYKQHDESILYKRLLVCNETFCELLEKEIELNKKLDIKCKNGNFTKDKYVIELNDIGNNLKNAMDNLNSIYNNLYNFLINVAKQRIIIYEEAVKTSLSTLTDIDNVDDNNIITLRKKYLDAVWEDVIEFFTIRTPQNKDKIKRIIDNPKLCGYPDIDFKNGVLLGSIYAIIYYCYENKVADPQLCMKLNHIQNDMMGEVLVKLDNES